MRSHLLEGKVRHRRSRPVVYALEHDVYYVALDLAELDEVDALAAARQPEPPQRPPVPRRRPLARARDRPAGDGPRPPPRARARTRATGGSRWSRTCGSSATSSTRPASTCAATRPATCASSSSRCTTRTWSATCTRCDRSAAGRRFVASMDKDFYVSPFIDMEGQYTVHVQDEPTRLRIAINERQGDAPLLSTSLVLERRRLTDRIRRCGCCSATRCMTQKTIGAHPLARPPPVAPRHPVPAPRRGRAGGTWASGRSPAPAATRRGRR